MQNIKTIPVLIDNHLHFLFPTKCETSYWYYKHCDGASYQFYDYSTYSIDYLNPEFIIKNITNNPDILLQEQINKLTRYLQLELKINPIFIKKVPSNCLDLREKETGFSY
jgi:hypothetical protein